MTEPAGPISIARATFRKMIADSPAFRLWIDASGDDSNQQAQALNRIHVNAFPPPLDGRDYEKDEYLGYLPCAVVWTGSPVYESIPVGSKAFRASGMLMADFLWEVPEDLADNDNELEIRLHNFMGELIQDFKALANNPGYLEIVQIDIAENFARTPEEKRPHLGDYIVMEMMAKWSGI
ncbi:MAG: hypothetical protein ACPGXK_00205 [Phycisphaerae bacterium]